MEENRNVYRYIFGSIIDYLLSYFSKSIFSYFIDFTLTVATMSHVSVSDHIPLSKLSLVLNKFFFLNLCIYLLLHIAKVSLCHHSITKYKK